MTPERASEVEGRNVSWTPKNPFIELEAGMLVRAMVAIGMRRARLQDAYTALQAKDPNTGDVDPILFERRLAELQEALPVVLNQINWTEFVHTMQMAGFRSRRNITSTMNIIYSYVLFLLGRTRYGVELTALRQAIASWLFMAQLTGRYTGSSESQLTKDLNTLAEVPAGDAEGFLRFVHTTIDSLLTSDYWKFTVPTQLAGSNPGLNPTYQCYLASLLTLDAKMFMLDMPVAQWMDPTLPVIKGLEAHHLFPKAYLQRELGVTSIKRTNQAANYAPTDWHTNIQISDDAPSEYWPKLVRESGLTDEQLRQQHYWHALPDSWERMPYDEFLDQRRKLMAEVIRAGFEKLSAGATSKVTAPMQAPVETVDVTLAELIEEGLLAEGDLLDPVDPDWVVDAVITADGTLMIDGEYEFDDLDAATRHLKVDNVTGLEFWALERGEDLLPLSEMASGLDQP